jgi:hypothetical protein
VHGVLHFTIQLWPHAVPSESFSPMMLIVLTLAETHGQCILADKMQKTMNDTNTWWVHETDHVFVSAWSSPSAFIRDGSP